MRHGRFFVVYGVEGAVIKRSDIFQDIFHNSFTPGQGTEMEAEAENAEKGIFGRGRQVGSHEDSLFVG